MYFNNSFPCTGNACLATAQVKVSVPVFFLYNHHLHFITDCKVWKVAEFIQRNQSITFKTNVQDNVSLCQTYNQSFHHLSIIQLYKSVIIHFVILFFFFFGVRSKVSFVNTPVEVIMCSSYCFHRCSCCRCSCF